MCNSSLINVSAPMSDQVTLGMVAKPSRWDDGWVVWSAALKSAGESRRVERTDGGSAFGLDLRNWEMGVASRALGRFWKSSEEEEEGRGGEGGADSEGGRASVVDGGRMPHSSGTSIPSIIASSPLAAGSSIALTRGEPAAEGSSSTVASGRLSRPPSSRNIRFTAPTPAALVRLARSAPTYPGVAFANARKSKSVGIDRGASSVRRILLSQRKEGVTKRKYTD